MTRRYYANTAPQLALAANLSSSATTCTLSAAPAGWPASFPYFAAFEVGTANMEIVLVTAAVGAVLTITRGQDGTSGVSHASGATLNHVFVAKDLDEPNAHIQLAAGVHGVNGSVVGTTDTQSLSAKTLLSPVVTGGLTVDTVSASGALSGASVTVSGGAAVGSLTVGGIALSGADIANLVPWTLDPLVPGGTAPLSAGANTAWYGRVIQPGTYSITTLSVPMGVGSGIVGCAIFRDNGSGAPGTLVVQSTTSSPIGGQVATFSLGGTFTLSRGDWLAVVSASGSTTFRAVTGGVIPQWRAVLGTGHAPGSLVSNPVVSGTTIAVPVWGQ